MAALPRLTIYERQQLAEWVCSEFNKVRKKKQNQCVYCRCSPAFLLRHLTENNVISGLQSRTSFSFCSVSQSLQPRCSSLGPRHQVVVCCRSRASLIPKKTKQKTISVQLYQSFRVQPLLLLNSSAGLGEFKGSMVIWSSLSLFKASTVVATLEF